MRTLYFFVYSELAFVSHRCSSKESWDMVFSRPSGDFCYTFCLIKLLFIGHFDAQTTGSSHLVHSVKIAKNGDACLMVMDMICAVTSNFMRHSRQWIKHANSTSNTLANFCIHAYIHTQTSCHGQWKAKLSPAVHISMLRIAFIINWSWCNSSTRKRQLLKLVGEVGCDIKWFV